MEISFYSNTVVHEIENFKWSVTDYRHGGLYKLNVENMEILN